MGGRVPLRLPVFPVTGAAAAGKYRIHTFLPGRRKQGSRTQHCMRCPGRILSGLLCSACTVSRTAGALAAVT